MDTSRRRDLERHGEARIIEGDLKKMGKSWKEVEKIAADRNQWRGVVSVLCATGRAEVRLVG